RFDGHPWEHRGEFYRSTGLSGTPRPGQRPHPPLLIGGAQERLLRWAGSVADIVSIGPSWQSRQIGPYPPSVGIEEGMDQQVRWVAEGAASAGRALSDLELSVTVMPVVFTDDPGEGFARAGAPHGISAADAERAPYILVGSVEEMAEAIRARHERWGVANWVVPAEVADAFAPVVQRVLAGG
ncbi:MAG: LLM class flavin-dependent oxidoreductase, partial [Acidimicrobiales bacterium]|nr:LLM class flavin-dependent oxidoreductase [Acidimicrobiales bacterium]